MTDVAVTPLESQIQRSPEEEAAFKIAMRTRILEFEETMRSLPTREAPVVHHFSKGLYAREIHLSAGTLITGKIHKYQNLSILSKGKVSVLTENGVQIFEAPATIIAPAGTKRVVYVHTDTVWTTIHATEETDVDKIEAEVIAKDFEECDRQLTAEATKLLPPKEE